MAHEFETGFFGGNMPAWHGLGTVIPEHVVTSEQAIKLAGLDWTVTKEQLEHRGHPIPGKFVTVRNTGKVQGMGVDQAHVPLGIVGTKFQPLQNPDAFAIGDQIVQSSGAHWHTAMSLADGRRVAMLLDLGQYNIGAEGEDIGQYLLVTNNHDGTAALRAAITDIRVVCQNTLTWALQGAQRVMSIRHTGDMQQKAHEAAHLLGLAQQRRVELGDEAKQLLGQPFTTPDFKRMIEVLVPIEEDASDRSVSIAQAKREKLYTGYKMSDNIDNIRGTRWGALQSVVETYDHVLTSRDNPERRFTQIIEGGGLVELAHEYLLEV